MKFITSSICMVVLLASFCKYAVTQDCSSIAATPLLDQYRRSSNYTWGTEEGESEPLIDDIELATGWYRFPGGQGDAMPVHPVDSLQCGTYNALWFNGSLPEKDGELVVGNACISSGETCDPYIFYEIKIMRCPSVPHDTTYVYYLQKTAYNTAYCIGQEVKCPEGESSDNEGFTPGCINGDFVTLWEDPTITYRVNKISQERREVVMQCNLLHNETNVVLHVQWYMDANPVKEIKDIPYEEFTAMSELFEDDWFDFDAGVHLPLTAMCKVRARYDDGELYGPSRTGSYWMGFQLQNTVPLNVTEGCKKPDYGRYKPTIPVLRPPKADSLQNTGLPVVIVQPEAGDAYCSDGRRLHQTSVKTTDSSCNLIIDTFENITDIIAELPIYAAGDLKVDGNVLVNLVLNTCSQLDSCYHEYHAIWSNYTFEPLQVLVVDQDYGLSGKFCQVHNDPHLLTMDGRSYDNHLEGEFWVYQHQSLPIGVQAYFRAVYEGDNEDPKYSKVCGAAVRAGNDLYVYDHCREGEANRERMEQCGDMEMVVDRQEGISEIFLPNGAEVYIMDSKIQIFAGSVDYEQILGLCGYFDGDCTNDFLGREGKTDYNDDDPCIKDGTLKPDCSNNKACGRHRMDEFSEEWRVLPEESYYQGKLPDVIPKSEVSYCICEEFVVNITTGEKETVPVCNAENVEVCTKGNNAVNNDSDCAVREEARNSGVGSDDVVDEVGPFKYDANFSAPEPEWSDGWNEDTARANCTNFFQQLSAFDDCIDVPFVNVEQFLDTCIADIMILSNTDFNLDHASSMFSTCSHMIMRNMSLFERDNTTGVVQPPTDKVKNICPSNCNLRGNCNDGNCECYEGYFGPDCFYDANHVPYLYTIPNNGMCDMYTRPCQQTPVTGHYFLKKLSLTCHIQPILILASGDTVEEDVVKTKGKHDHMERVMCPLPLVTVPKDVDVLTLGYVVAVSNDGETPSDTRQLTTYHSVCMECTEHFKCHQKETTCLVEGECYADGQASDSLSCMVCDGQSGQLEQKLESCLIEDSCYSAGDESPDPCFFCDPNNDRNAWTKAESCKPNTPAIAGASVAVVAAIAVVAVIALVVVKKKVVKSKTQVHNKDDIEVENLEHQTE